MSVRTVVVVTALLSVGCKKPPVEAPAELGELARFLFANFDDEDGEELLAGVPKLQEYLDDHDLEGKLDDRTYGLPPLTKDDWGGIQGPAGQSADDQLPIGVFGISRHNLAKNVELAGEKNHVCIESSTTKYYSRTFLSDSACFLSGDCDTLETANEVRKESIAAKVWYDLNKDYRVLVDDDGNEVMFARSWMEEVSPADGGNNSWDQLYALEVWVPAGNKTQRFHAFWSAVTIGAIGDDLYQAQVKDGIQEGFENADNFIDGELCKNDRDRPYDRP